LFKDFNQNTTKEMESILSSIASEKFYELSSKHTGYRIKWSLVSPLCKKWSRNRDPDMGRVSEMHEYYKKGGYIPKLVHLAELEGEGLVCYDGNHRREVFNKFSDEHVIIDVMFKASQKDVYDAFNNINKSVQLPAIYLEDQVTRGSLEDIINLVKSYETKYKQFVSSSSRYHAPHFNRDSFVDNVHAVYKALAPKGITIKDISGALERLNKEYSQGNMCRPHSSYKPHVLEKCQKFDFWLFLERVIPVEHVEKMI